MLTDYAYGYDEQKGEIDSWDNDCYKRFYIFIQGSESQLDTQGITKGHSKNRCLKIG
jgi:hypothetical protein